MSLAPTLQTENKISVGVGLVATAGLIANLTYGFLAPTSAGMSIAGNVPTLVVQTGPVTEPEIGSVTTGGLAPFLGRELRITAGLPDATPEQNDLTPTMVWQKTVLPTVGLATIAGLAPAVVADTGQFIRADVGLAVMSGLEPTIGFRIQEEPSKSPGQQLLTLNGLEATVFLQISGEIVVGALTITGLQPTLGKTIGWETVALAGIQVWTDVPTV